MNEKEGHSNCHSSVHSRKNPTHGEADPSIACPVRISTGRVIGIVRDGKFTKKVHSSRHMLRRPKRAWASDVDVLNQVTSLGATTIQLEDQDKDIIYEAPIGDLYSSNAFELDRGFGIQKALPLEFWNMRGEGVTQQLKLFNTE